MLMGVVAYAQRGAAPAAGQAPAPAAPAGRGPTPEQQARLVAQDALEKATPKLDLTEDFLPLSIPGHTIGETEGVSKDSKGNLYVYSRTGNKGPARGATAAQLFEFDPNLKFIKMWGEDGYGASFAHNVRVDKYDNVWMTDEGANMVVKFNPAGLVTMVLGRKPEAIDYLERFLERNEKDETRYPVGNANSFGRPTDVTWDTQENIFVSDGYTNSRVAKLTKDGAWVKALGTHGNGPNQFSTPHGITSDAKGNIYVADRGNNRIQVFDSDLNPKAIFSNVRAPWSVCMTPGPTQYLFSGDGGGNLYKLDLNGKLLAWSEITRHHGQTGCLVHELHCESENVVYKGDCSTWQVSKFTIKGTKPAGAN